MTKNTRILLCLLLLLAGTCPRATAQQDEERARARGRVVDEQTNEPLAFVNIGLVGTTLGVASGVDGHFELAVPQRYADHPTRFSAVGYASREMTFRELQGQGDAVIRLRPEAYTLADVRVVGTVDATRRLVEKVAANIPRNYIPRPYTYEGYFARAVTVNDVLLEKKEAIVLLHDKRGYERVDVEQAFADLNYTVTRVRRGTPATGGMFYFDDMVTADVVRHARNVLDTRNHRDYRFRDKGKTLHDGDTVQVIAYECLRPSPSTTGSANPLALDGEIYIHLRDLAVIKHVANITSAHVDARGRDLLPVDEPRQTNCTTTIVTSYRKGASRYFLGGASLVLSRETGGDRVRDERQYHTTAVHLDNPPPVEGRLYYEQSETDYRFWDRYTLTPGEE